jgi:hypothetical protein
MAVDRVGSQSPRPVVGRLSDVDPDAARESLAASADPPSARSRTTRLKQGEDFRLLH